MGGWAPDPFAVTAVKAVAYGAFGLLVQRRSLEPGGAGRLFGFTATRLVAGVAAGLLFFAFVVPLLAPVLRSDRLLYAAFQVPRVLLWAVLLQAWFRPRGGARAVALWSLAGLALSLLVDAAAFTWFVDVHWLRVPVC